MSTKNRSNSEIIADQLHSAAIHLLRRLRRVDAVSGLNAPRLSALSVIVFGGPVTLGELADAEQVRPPTMTRIVHALEKQGLITKTRDESDRRTVHISATLKGRKLLIEGRNRRIHLLAIQIDSLNEEEQAALRNTVAVMKKVIQAI
jgi:DNA-binding MarR family transcriptional regulator